MKILKSFIVLTLILLFYSFTFAAYSNLKEAINASGSNKTYSLTKKETVTADLNTLSGNLKVYGNGYEVVGGSKWGVTINKDHTLNINKGSGNSFMWSGFVNSEHFTKIEGELYYVNDKYLYKGGAIYNKGNVQIGDNITFKSNKVGTGRMTGTGEYDYGGAIYNDGGTIVINNNCTFDSNSAVSSGEANGRAYGGAIYNTEKGNISIGNNVTFNNNYVYNYTGNQLGHGGAIFNDTDSTITIGSDSVFSSNRVYKNGGAINNYKGKLVLGSNTIFDSNNAHNSGGAIYNVGTVTILDGAQFTNNTAKTKGGAIYNEGKTINLVANTNNVEFTGNTANEVSSAIHSDGGTINLWASENADVVFNDRINGSGTTNINKSTTTLTANGKIVLNESMNNYTGKINLYNGEIELKAKKSGTSQINTNKFFSGNINLSKGTLNILNNAIDNITVSTWTSTANVNLKFDTNLSNNTSDNFTVTNSATGQLNLTAINILGVNGETGQITLFKNKKSPTLNILTTANYGGYEYTFTNSDVLGVLNYEQKEITKTFKEVINETLPAIRSYSLAGNETVTQDLGNLGGEQLTIFGNGYEVNGSSKAGITVSEGQTLNIDKGTGENFVWENFNKNGNGGVICNTGVLTIEENCSFNSNKTISESGVSYGGAIYNLGIITKLKGNFENNSSSSTISTAEGGAIYNRSIIDSIEGNFINNSVSGINAARGGAIRNASSDSIIKSVVGNFIGNSVIANDNAYGGAIRNEGIIERITGDFINNCSSCLGGAIYNYQGTISLVADTKNIEFTGNTASGVSNAIFDDSGIINLFIEKDKTITFNDRLRAGSSTGIQSILNINKSSGTLPTTGKVILNEDMSGWGDIVNLYGGEIELQAKTEEGSNINTNKFFSGDINLENGTLNILNNVIDTITINNLTTTANANLKFDTNLSNNTSDNFTVTNSATGQLNLTAINILGIDEKLGQITLFNDEKAPTLNILTTGNYGGQEYVFTNSDVAGVLDYRLSGYRTFKETINDIEPLIRSYSLEDNETVTQDLGNLGGTQLTIFGNGYEVNGNSKQGISVSEGQILNIENGIGENFVWKNFYKNNNGGVIYNSSGTVTVASTTFKSNRARGNSSGTGSDYTGYGYGGAIYNDYGTITVASATFKSNNASGYGSSAYYSYQYGYGYGGAIYNDYGTIAIDSTMFESNSASGYGTSTNYAGTGRGYGGAIYNNKTITIDSTTFKSNSAMGYASGGSGYGGAIYNDTGTINISSTMFESNSAGGSDSNYDYGYGGAIYNDNGTIVIASTTFKSNKAIGSAYSYGGAIYTTVNSTTTFMDGVKFTNNEATKTQGGAIYNEGILNLIADTDNIEFTGNTANGISNAIHDKTGIINLWASENASVIFNDRITSEYTTSILNINQSSGTLPTIGKVILNEDMSGYKGAVNLYGGEIELQAKPNSSNINTNKFFSGNINLSSGTLNIQNNSIDNITVSNFTSTENSNLKFDTNLSNNTSDNFTVTNSASGVLNLTAINVLGVNGTSGQITLFKNSKAPTLNILTTANYGGYEYTFTNSGTSGVLNYLLTGYKTLKETVNATTPAKRSYSLAENETVTQDLGNLGGTQLTVFGNGFDVNGNSKAGINVSNGKTLNIEKGTGENFVWKNFYSENHGGVIQNGVPNISNSGIVNIGSNITFSLNGGKFHGGVIYNSFGEVNMGYNVIFSSNVAGSTGGTIYNNNGIIKISSNAIFSNNKIEGEGYGYHVTNGGGGAIYNMSNGNIEIDSNVSFISNESFVTNSALGGAILNGTESTITIKDGAKFLNNLAYDFYPTDSHTSKGGAIYNSYGTLNLMANTNDIEFTGNTANGVSNAIHDDNGIINLWASENADIIFNDRITSGNSSSILNINKEIENYQDNVGTGKIVLNEYMRGYTGTVNLYGGEIELQAKTNENSNINTNTLFSGNINLSSGTLNIQNNAIDNITINNLTTTENANLKFDTDLSNNTSDNFTVTNSATGELNLTAINILGVNGKTGQITLFNNEISPELNILTTANYNGKEYTFTNSDIDGVLNYKLSAYKTFKETINETEPAIRSYSLSEDEIVLESLGQLGGTQLTVFGNGYGVDGNSRAGIVVGEGQTLNIEKGTGENFVWEKFHSDTLGSVIMNNGNLNIEDNVIFSSNSTTDAGGVITNHYNLTIGNNVIFSSNTAKFSGGAIRSLSVGDIGGNINIGNNVNFSSNTSKSGGAIYILSGNMNIGDNASFNLNIADTFAGAIYFSGSSISTIGENSIFTSNTAGVEAGAISNGGSNITIGSNSTFSNNSSGNIGGAIYASENSTTTIRSGAVFSSNTVSSVLNNEYAKGGAIYNNTNSIMTIGDDASFINNSTIAKDESLGGVFYNFYGSNITIGNNILFSSNSCIGTGDTTSSVGGVMYNSSSTVTMGNQVNISNNETNAMYASGGAINNDYYSSMSIGNDVIFSSNSSVGNYLGYGGALYTSNSNNTIGNNASFIGNKTIAETESYGGAIVDWNRSNITIGSNAIFSFNSAESTDTNGKSKGGAVYIAGDDIVRTVFTITDGAQFTNNTSLSQSLDSYGGAIYNEKGVLNLIANTNNVEFTGNTANGISNAIHDNRGIINLWASQNADIIFNDRITGEDNNNVLNINQSSGTLPTAGKIVLNEDMSGYTGAVNLYGGEIELQAKTNGNSNVNTNKLFNGDINLETGTLNILNNVIDNIIVSTWTSTANTNLKFDTDLSNNTSDNFTVTNNATGTLNLTAINLLGVEEETGTIILFNDEKSPELNVLTTGVYNGYEYSFSTTTQKGVLDYKLTGTNKTFKEVVNDITPGYRSYSLANNETVTQDLGQLGGTQLTVFGNGFEVNGNSKAGINVSNGQILNIDKGTGEKFSWNNFDKTGHGTVIFNEGTTNISSNVEFYLNTGTRWGGAIYNNEILNIDSNVVFTSNTARCGGAIINYGGTTDISSSTFVNNIATLWGGALENTEYGTLNITSALFSSNIATQSGGAIQSLEGTITISSSTFIENSAQSYGGAIANEDGGIVIISSSAFSKNQTNGTGGAINNNDDGIINITSSTFSENVAGVVGGAVFNCKGIVSISSSSFTKNKAESNTGKCSGGAIDNNINGIITIKDSSSFSENRAKLGGAIENNGTATIISSVFNGNIATEIGGAIDNSNRLTIENSVFTNNTANVGGAIENKDENSGVVLISSSLFNSNTATNIGGAIHNNKDLTVTIQDGTRFTNNTATTNGGAIYNEGIINLIANTNNVEFTNNKANGVSNAIHDNGGVINLWASENADIVFNDRITSEDSTSILNINSSTTTLTANGKVVLNEDMSGWVGTTNLYNGNLEIAEGNNFVGGNFTVYGGTFTANANSIITDFTNDGTVNLTGGTIANNITGISEGIINVENDKLTINEDVSISNNNINLATELKLLNEESLNTSTLTINNGAILNTQNDKTGTIDIASIVIEDGANWTYQLDVDLKSAKADNLVNVESVGNGSKATIDDIHLLSDKATKTSIQIADNDIKAQIAQDNFKIYTTNLSYGVTTSLDSNSNTLLNIEAIGYGGLANAIYDGASTYSVTEDIDYLTKWIEDPIGTTHNKLKGNLTISNISSNNRVLKSTNNVEGLITEGYTLQINNVNLDGFNEAIKVNNTNGNLQLTNVIFSSNTGNAIIASSGTVELSGVVFDNTNTTNIDVINDNSLILSGSSTTFTTGIIGKGTTTINGVDINLANARIEQDKIGITDNGSLTANASNITADIENNSNLIFSEGTNSNYIFGTGNTVINGEVINSSIIVNNVTINSQKQLTTNATNIDGQIENNGDLIFNGGTNDNYIHGNGKLSIEGYVISNSSITLSTVTVASAGKFENNNKLQLIDYINNGTTVNNSTISVSGEYYNVGITTNTNYIKANIYTNKADSVMDNTGMIDADEFNIENGSMFNTSFDNLVIKGDFENDGEVTVKGGEIKNNILGEGKLIIENIVVNNKDINQSSITINTEATLTNNKNITLDQILINNGQLTNEGNIETEQLNNVANSTITNNSNFTVNKKGQNYGRIDGNGILNINDDFDNFSYLGQSLINISSGTFTNENTVISDNINLQEKAKLMSNANNITGNILNAGNVILTGGENSNWIYGTGTTIINGEVINSSTIVNNVKINETKKLTTSAEGINGDIVNDGILIINSGKENNNKITGIGRLFINCNLTNNNIIRQKELSLNLTPNVQFASSLNSSDNNSQLSVFTNNSEIAVETLNLKDTMLKLTENGSLAVDNLSSQNSAMDLANSLTQQHNFKSISVTDKLDLAVDVDLKNKTMDTISADIYDEDGNIDINKINIVTELKGNNTEIAFTTSTVLKDKITSITTASSNLFKYNVEYNKNAGTLNFSVTAKDNPTMVAGQIANIADGLITQTTVLNQAFSSIDNIRGKITSAKEKGLLYASTADVVFDSSSKLERGLWLRPFYSQESINFDSLSVDNTLTGTLAGIDLVTSENSLVSVYLGYAGSEQKYEQIKVNQTGYIVGATGMLIKDEWYIGLTANVNFNKAESQSDYGTDSFDMNMYSVGTKAGYNYEINDKWTLEPNLTLMYGNVNSAEYQTTQGAKVEGQSVANIIVAPQVKAKLSLTNGWQPYGLLGYVINCGDKVKANVEGVEFEQQKIENYIEFGAGVNKTFENTPWSLYIQLTGRSGDRSGFDGNLGVKYSF